MAKEQCPPLVLAAESVSRLQSLSGAPFTAHMTVTQVEALDGADMCHNHTLIVAPHSCAAAVVSRYLQCKLAVALCCR